MTTYTTLSDTTMAQDKPLTQSVSRALRDNPLAIAEGDATAPKIDPKAIRIQQVYARLTGDTTVTPTSGEHVIVFNSETVDAGSFYSTSTGKFQPTEAGTYFVQAQMLFGTVSGTWHAWLAKNGTSTRLSGKGSLVSSEQVVLTALITMNGSTDYVETRLYDGGGGNCVIKGNESNFGSYQTVFVAFKVAAQ